MRYLLALTLVLPLVALEVAAGEPVLSEEDQKHFQAVLDAVDARHWRTALKQARKASDPLPAQVVIWQQVASEAPGITWDEARHFHLNHPDWPGRARRLEFLENLMPDGLSADETRTWFDTFPPVSGWGKVRYAEALFATGQQEAGTEFLRDGWVHHTLRKGQAEEVIQRHGSRLSESIHAERLNHLLWKRKWRASSRQLEHVSPDIRLLGEARIHLAKRRPGVDAAVARVPDALKGHPGLIYERARWRRLADRQESALELFMEIEDLRFDLGPRPNRWWKEMRRHVRRLISEGRRSEAYDLVSRHWLPPGAEAAEAEWIAGWLALRFLDRPEIAYRHFQNMQEMVFTPISRARAGYWGGLSLEHTDPDRARVLFEEAARFPATYYGQLATRWLGRAIKSPVPPPSPDPAARDRWSGRDTTRLLRALGEAGHGPLFRNTALSLARQAGNSEELFLLHELCVAYNHLDVGLLALRRATLDGYYLPALFFPVDEVRYMFESMDEEVETALAMAVARQESGFGIAARSHAKAQGVMQIMPATAKWVSRKSGIPYSAERLISDPHYNVRLGTYYLRDLIDRFDGSYVVALAGYNAGPGRARRWRHEHGDPATGEISPVDWIELIPWSETRNYVQRVLEGLTVYRLLLGEKTANVIEVAQ